MRFGAPGGLRILLSSHRQSLRGHRCMRIRTKLTGLLVLFALAPLAIATLDAAFRTRALGAKLSQQTASRLGDQAERSLEQLALGAAQRVRSIRRRAEISVRWLATEAETVLRPDAGSLDPSDPTPSSALVPIEALDDGSELPGLVEIPARYFQVGPQGRRQVLPVTFDLAATFAPRAANIPSASRNEIEKRFARLLPIFRTIRDATPDAVRSQAVIHARGVAAVHPVIAAYPAGYDFRDEPWYRRAAASEVAIWSEPRPDPVTGQQRLVCARAVLDERSDAIAVAAVDMLVLDLLAAAESDAQWPIDARLSLLSRSQAGDLLAWSRGQLEGSRRLQRRSIGPSDPLQPLAAPHLAPGEGYPPGVIADPIDAERPASSDHATTENNDPESDDTGDDAHVHFVVGAGPGLAVTISAPSDVARADADRVEEELTAEAEAVVRRAVALALLVAGIAGAVAYVAARTVTRPITELATKVHRVAEGESGVRFERSGRDEVARLSRDLSRMVPRLAESVRLGESLALTRELQQIMPPASTPDVPGFDVHGYSRYCDESRGDYFDYLDLTESGPNHFAFTVGDVTGHGIPAALLMTAARTALKSLARENEHVGRLLGSVNRALAAESHQGRFMTLFYLLLDLGQGSLRWANAGHDAALVYHPERDAFEQLGGGGLPLGVDEDETYDEHQRPLPAPGSVIFLGTDGIWETRGPSGEMFGRERIRDLIRRHHAETAGQIGAAIAAALDEFRGSEPLVDDITFVVLRVQSTAEADTHEKTSSAGAAS